MHYDERYQFDNSLLEKYFEHLKIKQQEVIQSILYSAPTSDHMKITFLKGQLNGIELALHNLQEYDRLLIKNEEAR